MLLEQALLRVSIITNSTRHPFYLLNDEKSRSFWCNMDPARYNEGAVKGGGGVL